jgi:arginyl-tRNA synthetase
MRDQILDLLRNIVGADHAPDVSIPDSPDRGHYSTSIALRLAKERKQAPLTVAEDIKEKLLATAPKDLFEKVEVAPPGFVNIWLTSTALGRAFNMVASGDQFAVPQTMQRKTVMVEYTDANPFKLFHIGHLMTNSIGEAFARLSEAVGAKVLRASYQGDVGMHVAMCLWGMQDAGLKAPTPDAPLRERVEYLGKAYAAGSAAQESAKAELETLNRAIYDRSDAAVNELYDMGRKWSLEYFEEIYKRLDTKFDQYFFESEAGPDGKAVVEAHTDVFTESDGAIVFKGEPYGLHTRVFVNSRGLPTYEAKELGLNKKKFELYPLDLSIVITGNEIVDYFKVLLKVMELVLPNVAARTRHAPHGMLRLPTGKMSSRTGDVITAEALIDQTKQQLAAQEGERATELSSAEQDAVREAVAIGAIKYSILRQHPGADIIFDFDKSLSLHGESGPYVQYTYARLRSILRKAEAEQAEPIAGVSRADLLTQEVEQAVVRKVIAFPDAVHAAAIALTPNTLAKYLYDLAVLANRFYERAPILKEENADRRAARLALAVTVARVLEHGLQLLGIKAPERM